MQFSFLLNVAAASDLIFSYRECIKGDNWINRPSFRMHEIRLRDAVMSLNHDQFEVSGLDRNSFLICFREGHLIFPNNLRDRSANFKIHMYDVMYWMRIRNPDLQAFTDAIFPVDGPKLSKEQLFAFEDKAESIYRFSIIPSSAASIKQKCITGYIRWQKILCIPLAILFLLALVGIPLYLILESVYTPFCQRKDVHEYQLLSYMNEIEPYKIYELGLEVPKVCGQHSFNISDHQDRIANCLQQIFDFGGWKLISNPDIPPLYASTQDIRPLNRCPLNS